MRNMDKLMEKKKLEGPMDPSYKSAKMNMLMALRNEMSNMMKDDLKQPMKKVEVASDSPEGLKAGLEKAESMVPEGELSEEDSFGSSDGEEEPLTTQEEGHSEDLSDEDIAHLEAMLAEAKAKKGRM